MASYREISKVAYAPPRGAGLVREDINTGCLQRIADAVEKMAESHDKLISSRDYFKRRCEELRIEADALRRSRVAYKAVVTRMKRAAAKGGRS